MGHPLGHQRLLPLPRFASTEASEWTSRIAPYRVHCSRPDEKWPQLHNCSCPKWIYILQRLLHNPNWWKDSNKPIPPCILTFRPVDIAETQIVALKIFMFLLWQFQFPDFIKEVEHRQFREMSCKTRKNCCNRCDIFYFLATLTTSSFDLSQKKSGYLIRHKLDINISPHLTYSIMFFKTTTTTWNSVHFNLLYFILSLISI